MTNLEAITHQIGSNADLSEDRIRFAAEFEGVNPDEEYDPDNRCKIFGLAITEILTDKGVKKFSESDYSVEFADNTSIAIQAIAKRSGCATLIAEYIPVIAPPVIRNASNRW